jgi:type I restriction enzyme M protein
MKKQISSQKEILFEGINKDGYSAIFKRLYFHLYSNSKSSRAETIIEDLSKILLIKLATSNKDIDKVVKSFLKSEDDANESLIPKFSSYYPQLSESLSRFTLDSSSIRICFQELEDLDINDAPSHIIGDAFQSLIGPTLRGDKGQFFTPKSVVSAMVEIVNPEQNCKIVDPACGTGGFLIDAFSHVVSKVGDFTGILLGIDKDKFLANTAKSICEIYSSGKYQIVNQNSLDLAFLKKEHPIFFDADIVLTNPPFGAKIGITDKNILKQYDLGYNWTFVAIKGHWEKTNHLRNEQDPQTLFIELCLRLLKENGVLGIVLPEGIFGNKGDGYIWDFLRVNGEIIAMIDCPRTAFQPSTDVKTNILFFRKKKVSKPSNNTVFKVAVAINCGHDRRGRRKMENGANYPDDFPKIAKEFNAKSTQYWTKGIAKDSYYLVPRYCQESNKQKIQLNSSITEFIGIFSFLELIEKKYISVRKGNEIGSEAYGTGDIPFIRTSDIANLEITNDPTKSVSEDYYEKYKKMQGLKEFDILMVADGRYRIGKTAILIGDKTKSVVQSHVKIIRVLSNAPFNAFELLYILNQSYVVSQIRNLIFIQSTLGSLGNRINELLIPVPKKTKLWEEKINEFEKTLKSRNQLLVKLKEFQVEEAI